MKALQQKWQVKVIRSKMSGRDKTAGFLQKTGEILVDQLCV
jgi:hypothetical protein